VRRFSQIVNAVEEGFIAFLLAAMTLVTFSQVIARYVFNSGAVWALELTVTLFAWLVLFGMSYGIKVGAHLGVDALVNLFRRPIKRLFGLLAVIACLAYAGLLLKGAWDYWSLMYGIGLEVQDIPFPGFIQAIFGLYEDGEPYYEYLPRYVVYAILPLGIVLLIIRLLQAGVEIVTGRRDLLIVSHEVEDALEEAAKEAEPLDLSGKGRG